MKFKADGKRKLSLVLILPAAVCSAWALLPVYTIIRKRRPTRTQAKPKEPIDNLTSMKFKATGKRTLPMPGKDLHDITPGSHKQLERMKAILPIWTGTRRVSMMVDPVPETCSRHMPKSGVPVYMAFGMGGWWDSDSIGGRKVLRLRSAGYAKYSSTIHRRKHANV